MQKGLVLLAVREEVCLAVLAGHGWVDVEHIGLVVEYLLEEMGELLDVVEHVLALIPHPLSPEPAVENPNQPYVEILYLLPQLLVLPEDGESLVVRDSH